MSDSLSVLSAGKTLQLVKYMRELHLAIKRKTITCSTDDFVPLVAVTKQSATPHVERYLCAEEVFWHARGNSVPGQEVEETTWNLLELLSERKDRQ